MSLNKRLKWVLSRLLQKNKSRMSIYGQLFSMQQHLVIGNTENLQLRDDIESQTVRWTWAIEARFLEFVSSFTRIPQRIIHLMTLRFIYCKFKKKSHYKVLFNRVEIHTIIMQYNVMQQKMKIHLFIIC